jgi:hypothetical protein
MVLMLAPAAAYLSAFLCFWYCLSDPAESKIWTNVMLLVCERRSQMGEMRRNVFF